MDDIDRQLITLLRKDARTPVATLADKLGVSRGTVSNRLRRLEDDQLIVGYTVRLRPEAEPHRVRAFMSIEVQGPKGDEVRRALRGHPHVVTLHTTNGRWDLVAELHAASLEQFDRVLNEIRRIEGIAHSETSLLLSTHKA